MKKNPQTLPRRLARVVRELVQAEINATWAGSRPPAEAEEIKALLKEARLRYHSIQLEIREHLNGE